MLNRWIGLRQSTAVRLPSIYALPFNLNRSRSGTSGEHFCFIFPPPQAVTAEAAFKRTEAWAFEPFERTRSKAESPPAAAGFKPQFRRRFPHLHWHIVVGGELTDCQECTVGISLSTEHLGRGRCSRGPPPSIHPAQPLALPSDCRHLPYWPYWVMCCTNSWKVLFTNRWSITVLQTVKNPTTRRMNIGILFQDSSEKTFRQFKKIIKGKCLIK